MIDERSYLAVLHEELVPAQGCTEPIALAYCSAQARKALGTDPENIRVLASGNIIKNVKSVVVPGTNGRRGIETAAVFGALAGDPEKKLEVLTGMPADRCRMAEEFLEHPEKCTVEHLKTDAKLHMIVEVCGGGHVVRAELKDRHTNIVRIEKDGEDIFRACPAESLQEHYTDRSFMLLTEEFLDVVGNKIDGTIVMSSVPAFLPSVLESGELDAASKNFVDSYTAEYNEVPDGFAASAFDAVNIVLDAVAKVGTDTPALREELKTLRDYPGVSGYNMSFNEQKEMVKGIYLFEIQDGQFVRVK